MHADAILFGAIHLKESVVAGARVLEVGARKAGRPELRGTLRPLLSSHLPSEYVGVDAIAGEGVDVVCAAEELIDRFGPESFDVVVCTEVLEHVRGWRAAVHNLKGVCRPAGLLLLTTRSRGFPYHGFPADFWRFEIEDFRAIFSDLEILELERDRQFPGVFLLARKPIAFEEADLGDHRLYSILADERRREIADRDFATARFGMLKATELAREGVYSLTTWLKRRLLA